MSTHFQLICGGREFADRRAMKVHIGFVKNLCDQAGHELVIVEGGARGADSLARSVAKEFGVLVVEVAAEWDRYGKSAGYKRNVAMAEILVEAIERGDTADVVAFPGGVGTEHMKRIARERDLRVFRPKALACVGASS